jgi:hypothetical protein
VERSPFYATFVTRHGPSSALISLALPLLPPWQP